MDLEETHTLGNWKLFECFFFNAISFILMKEGGMMITLYKTTYQNIKDYMKITHLG
jgi:hypothetical protein